MSGIYPESLKQCVPALRDIPEEPEEFRLASKNHQRVSLVLACRRGIHHVGGQVQDSTISRLLSFA